MSHMFNKNDDTKDEDTDFSTGDRVKLIKSLDGREKEYLIIRIYPFDEDEELGEDEYDVECAYYDDEGCLRKTDLMLTVLVKA